MLGTSGRIDSEHLMDVPRGFTPPLLCAGVQIAISICQTEMPLLADLGVQTKTPTEKGGCRYLVPVASHITLWAF